MGSNTKFLEKVAEHILSNSGKKTLDTLVVFPNRRSAIFLKKYLMQQVSGTYWLPEIITIDDLMIRASGLNVIEPIKIHFELYKIHCRINGKQARTLDDFLNWAAIILHDFEEIDYTLADTQKLFSYLSEAKAIDKWNPDGTPLTPMQRDFLFFFQSLIHYYNNLKEKLLQNHSAYKAMVYRYAAENSTEILDRLSWKKYYFIGFNALTKSELQFTEHLRKHFELDFIIDGDTFYLQNSKLPQHEAGHFLNNLFDRWKITKPLWVGDDLTATEKHIEIASVPKLIGQAKYAGQLLQEWLGNNRFKPEETAIVLGDENLLIPLLSSLPDKNMATGEKLSYNLTLGYPLSQSPYNNFISRWIELLILSYEDPSGKIFIPAFLHLINSSLANYLYGESSNAFLTKITEHNSVLISYDKLIEIARDTAFEELPRLLTANIRKPENFPSAAGSFLLKMQQQLDHDDNKNILWKNQTILLRTQINNLKNLLEEYDFQFTYRTLQKLFNRIFNTTPLSLLGEPLSGIQIMGMLETRNLDFKNIIVLGMNEGVLPSNNFQDTLIPFDIRKNFGLPLPQDNTAVYTYHFFRLLQRTENAVFIYNSYPGELGGGEKSRFLLQIRDELCSANPLISYTETTVGSPFSKDLHNSEIVVEKTNEIVENLNKIITTGLSPSALTTFIICPLKFYFRYVIGLKEEDQLEEFIESNIFGSVLHGVLEDIYSRYIGKPIDISTLQSTVSKFENQLKNRFLEFYGTSDFSYGKNLLIYNVAKEYIGKFLNYDLYELRKTPREIIALEKKFETEIFVNEKKISLYGYFDRIDYNSATNEYRIIDYKTGKVDKRDLYIKEWQQLIESEKFTKSFQVLFYAYLFHKKHADILLLQTGLISMVKLSAGYQEPHLPDEVTNINSITNNFEEVLKILLSDILNSNQPFAQRIEDRQCTFCDFRSICNRG